MFKSQMLGVKFKRGSDGLNLLIVFGYTYFGNLAVFLHIFQSFYKVLIVMVYVIFTKTSFWCISELNMDYTLVIFSREPEEEEGDK